MATKKKVTPPRIKQVPISTGKRASQRGVPLIIDLGGDVRHLMIEQCKVNGDYLTIYRGSQAELMAAGVSDTFPKGVKASRFSFQLRGHAAIMLSASLERTATGFEMEVNWGAWCPGYCSHPAIVELARMLLIDVHSRAGSGADPDLSGPINRVIEDERAVDYKPGPGAPHLQVTRDFNDALGKKADELYDWVLWNCEVFESKPAAKKSPSLKLVVDNSGARLPEVSHGQR